MHELEQGQYVFGRSAQRRVFADDDDGTLDQDGIINHHGNELCIVKFFSCYLSVICILVRPNQLIGAQFEFREQRRKLCRGRRSLKIFNHVRLNSMLLK